MSLSKKKNLVFRHAEIIDGSGAPAFIGDVAVSGERIVGVERSIEYAEA